MAKSGYNRKAQAVMHASAAIFGLFVITALHAQDSASAVSGNSRPEEVVAPPSQQGDSVAAGPLVKEIEVEYAGPKSVSKSVILANMRTTVGQPYSRAAVENDVRNLYKTNLFSNLRIYDEPLADGVKVIIIVQPKPLIKEIVLVGYSQFKEAKIRSQIKTKVGETLNEQSISADAVKISDYYQSKGFKDAQITYKTEIREESGRAVVTFNINEGGRQYINSIQFVGNTKFSAKQLLKGDKKLFETPDPDKPPTGIKTRPRSWLSWLFGTGTIKDEQWQEDLSNVKRYYQNNGYIDMEITGVEFKPASQKDYIDVIVNLTEGIQYRLGTLQIDGFKLYNEPTLRSRIAMKEGRVYSPWQMEKDIKSIKDLYGEQGYVDCQVIPAREPAVESGRMDLVYNIREGDQAFVERIVIQGNNKTKDKVIRRELAVAPGEVYNTIRADASKKRLENLNYFSKVDISPQDTNIPSRKNMVVTVEEQRTGSFTFGVGFSSVDSLLGFVELNQGNFDIANWPTFTGAGQKMRVRAQYGTKRQDYVLSFTEPWFLNRRLSLGTDIFYRTASYLSDYYDEQRYGFNIKFAKPINQFLTARAVYKFENIGIVNVDNGAPDFIKAEAGDRIRSAVEIGLTHDTRDSVFLSRKGHKVDLYGELVGGPFLGDTDIYKFGFEAQKFFLLPMDFIFSLQAAAAVVDSYGDSPYVPLFDRLFAGGSNTIRGFKYRDVGPKNLVGEAIGGGTMAYTNAEVTFPIMDRVRGAMFVDGGFVNWDAYDFDLSNFNMSTGIGLRLNLPIGPLRMDYAFPIVTDSYNNDGGQFHFNMGYQF